MEQIVKIPALQNTFSATKNLVDIEIPDDGVYDLSKSYVNVNISVDNDDADAGNTGVGINNVMINMDDPNDLILPNSCLVKNAHLTSSLKGNICDIRHQDTLRGTLDAYQTSRSDRNDRTHLGQTGTEVNSWGAISPFRELQCLGDNTVVSRNVAHDVRIPLGSVFDICKEADAFNSSAFGKTKIHFEMNFDKVNSHFNLGATDGTWGATDGDSNATYGAMDGTGAGTTQSITSLTTTKSYRDPEHDSPFWINQKLRVSFTIGAGAQPVQVRKITAIAQDPATGKLILTLDAQLVNLNNDQLSAVSVVGQDPTNVAISFNQVELVLQRADPKKQPQSGYEYTCYTTELDSVPSLTNFAKNYMVEPNATNLFVMCMNNNNSIVSDKNDITSYRFTVNNKVQTNRKIPIRSPLYFDGIQRVFRNAQLPLKSLHENIGVIGGAEGGTFGVRTTLPALPLPLTANMKIVGVDLEAGTGINNVRLYKQVQRKI
jgi:hypothetical protein